MARQRITKIKDKKRLLEILSSLSESVYVPELLGPFWAKVAKITKMWYT